LKKEKEMKKRFLAILVVMVMLLSLLIAGCDSFDPVTEEPTPEPEPAPTPTATPEPTPEPVVDELEEIDEEEEEEEEELITPETPTSGPLTADFIALLASRNYYIKFDQSADVTEDPESDIEVTFKYEDGVWTWMEATRQNDVFAYTRYYSYNQQSVAHNIYIDYKRYSIKHDVKKITIYESSIESADDSGDFLPVSLMYYIGSGEGSVNGETMPYEAYAVTGQTIIWRFYVNGDKVAYWVRINNGVVRQVEKFLDISPEIPSYMFEMPENYTVEEDS